MDWSKMACILDVWETKSAEMVFHRTETSGTPGGMLIVLFFLHFLVKQSPLSDFSVS